MATRLAPNSGWASSPLLDMNELQHGTGTWANMQDVVRLAVKALADGVAAQQSQSIQLRDMIGALRRHLPEKTDKVDHERLASALQAVSSDTSTLRSELASLKEELRGEMYDIRKRLDKKAGQDEMAACLEGKANTQEVAELRARSGRNQTSHGFTELRNWQTLSDRMEKAEKGQSNIQRRLEDVESHAALVDPIEIFRRVESAEKQVALKADAGAMELALNAKANRLSVASALHKKASKVDVGHEFERQSKKTAKMLKEFTSMSTRLKGIEESTGQVPDALAELANRFEDVETSVLAGLDGRIQDIEAAVLQQKSVADELMLQLKELQDGGIGMTSQWHQQQQQAVVGQSPSRDRAALTALETQLNQLGDEMFAKVSALENHVNAIKAPGSDSENLHNIAAVTKDLSEALRRCEASQKDIIPRVNVLTDVLEDHEGRLQELAERQKSLQELAQNQRTIQEVSQNQRTVQEQQSSPTTQKQRSPRANLKRMPSLQEEEVEDDVRIQERTAEKPHRTEGSVPPSPQQSHTSPVRQSTQASSPRSQRSPITQASHLQIPHLEVQHQDPAGGSTSRPVRSNVPPPILTQPQPLTQVNVNEFGSQNEYRSQTSSYAGEQQWSQQHAVPPQVSGVASTWSAMRQASRTPPQANTSNMLQPGGLYNTMSGTVPVPPASWASSSQRYSAQLLSPLTPPANSPHADSSNGDRLAALRQAKDSMREEVMRSIYGT